MVLLAWRAESETRATSKPQSDRALARIRKHGLCHRLRRWKAARLLEVATPLRTQHDVRDRPASVRDFCPRSRAAETRPSGQQDLGAFTQVLKKCPDTEVVVQGFTDSTRRRPLMNGDKLLGIALLAAGAAVALRGRNLMRRSQDGRVDDASPGQAGGPGQVSGVGRRIRTSVRAMKLHRSRRGDRRRQRSTQRARPGGEVTACAAGRHLSQPVPSASVIDGCHA
jgi:hypothetical protein